MTKLKQMFEMTAGADADAHLATPDLAYAVQLLRDAGESLCLDDLEQLYAEENWKADRSFTWPELQALQHRIQTTGVNADAAKATGHTGNSDHQLPADPAEESVGADMTAHTSLPRVDVGGADAEEQTRRRTLLGRAIPADLDNADRLIATDYAKFIEEQPAEVRPYLPSTPPELFRSKRYFSNLEIEVCEREHNEQIEHVISHLPVHPRDGGVDPAEQERRLAWIQKLSPDEIQQVHTLVRDKWQQEVSLAPASVSALLPADPPRAFWTAQYYICMAELVETLHQQQQVPDVCLDREHAAAETTSLQTEMTHGEAGKDLRRETHSMVLQARCQQGQAANGEEADPAGVIYGVEAIMEGTAYAEDITEPEDESQIPFIGSLRLLMDAQPGARVNYEGKLVCGDPTPRELAFKDASGSPRKRSSQDLEDKNTNTACDIVLD